MFSIGHQACQSCLKKVTEIHQKCNASSLAKWTSKDIRQQFLDFFCKNNDHQFVRSSSVIPGKHEGVYFTNAGMNQFKPIFLGTAPEGSDLASYRRVANSQKCIRVGGKHNDLQDVGHDLTHHTFFEMLGSWSFGDYFKKEACSMALELLVNVYKLPREKLYFTYFGGCPDLDLPADLDCREIWRELGVPDSHLLPFGMKDNFWDMGETGPCGPCTEIHYDHVGNRNVAALVNMDSPEVVEIWNLVFMQYNRLGPAKLVPLPSTHVDTGMGLERLCAVKQGTRSNYNTDLFLPIFDVIHKETGVPAYSDRNGSDDRGRLDTAYRILADHARMASVCISDGLLPGRDFIEHRLRTVIYRALYQSHQVIKAGPGLLSKLVHPVADSLGEAHPEIAVHAQKVSEVLNQTEDRYVHMYEEGKKNFNKLLTKYSDIKTLDVENLLKLRDGYYGHPMSPDFIEIIAAQYGLDVEQGLHDLHEHVQQQVPTATEVEYPCFTADLLNDLQSRNIPATHDEHKYQFTVQDLGHYDFPSIASEITCLVDDHNRLTDRVDMGCRVGVLVNQTSFYAEKGGQAGDSGIIQSETGCVSITDTQSSHDHILHIGTVTKGYMLPRQLVTLEIDPAHRSGCMRNHTATHLVNAALRRVLGADVCQRGSSVLPDKLTFDFSCMTSVTNQHIEEIDRLVKLWISQDIPIQRTLTPLKQALQDDHLVHLENVVYPNEVYVVSIDEVVGESHCTSKELCGGTHVLKTGDIGGFCITNVAGQSSATKSIVCLTGDATKQVEDNMEKVKHMFEDLKQQLKCGSTDLDQCLSLQKQTNHILGSEVLPKVFKDGMRKAMDGLGTDINVLLNKQAFKQLEQDLGHKMADPDVEFIVHQFSVKVLPKLNKLMKKLTIHKPLILVVQTSNNMVAYIAFPQNHLKSQEHDTVLKFCEMVKGHVDQTEKNYRLVKGQGCQAFMTAANRLREDFSTEKSNNISSKIS